MSKFVDCEIPAAGSGSAQLPALVSKFDPKVLRAKMLGPHGEQLIADPTDPVGIKWVPRDSHRAPADIKSIGWTCQTRDGATISVAQRTGDDKYYVSMTVPDNFRSGTNQSYSASISVNPDGSITSKYRTTGDYSEPSQGIPKLVNLSLSKGSHPATLLREAGLVPAGQKKKTK